MEDKGAGAPRGRTHYQRDLALLWSTRGVHPRPPAPVGSCWTPGQVQLRGATMRSSWGLRGAEGGLLRIPLSLPWACRPTPWLRSSSQEFSIPCFISLSSASPLPGFKHFLSCLQLTPALPSSEFLLPTEPCACVPPRAGVSSLAEGASPAREAGTGAVGHAPPSQGAHTSTSLTPVPSASSLFPDCPQKLGPQHPGPALLKGPRSRG